MSKDTNGTCEGCTIFGKIEWCDIIKHGREKDCPCRNCLVKVMCSKPCEKYNLYLFKEDLL